jgi:HlyD family secretion protein
MSQIALPNVSASRRWPIFVIAPVAVVLVLAGAWSMLPGTSWKPVPTGEGVFHVAAPMDLDILIRRDGELQAVENIDIVSRVEGHNAIQFVVKEGSSVTRGDVLLTLDSADIRQKLEDAILEVKKAEAALSTSRELLEIQKNQNGANLEAAEVALELAKLDLQQYVEGSYPQLLLNAQTKLQMAQINLKNREDTFEQTRKLFAKGFVTMNAVKDDELKFLEAQNAVRDAEKALNVLEKFTHPMDLASKRNALSQAEQRLIRVRRENASNISQREIDLQTRSQEYEVRRRRQERYEQQVAHATIRAPADGMVVYATSSDRNAQNMIQEGTMVRERQALLRLPDTSSMKSVLRVNESQVWRLSEGMKATVKVAGVPEPISARVDKISVLPDSAQRWWNPDLKEYVVDVVLDRTPQGLKPGMGTQAEIFIDRLHGVMALPLTTLYGVGREHYVFVRRGDDVEPRKVRLGQASETHAEVIEGITEGEQVLVLQMGQGRELLEAAGIRVQPTTQPGERRRRGGDQPQPNGTGAQPARPQGESGTVAPSPAPPS